MWLLAPIDKWQNEFAIAEYESRNDILHLKKNKYLDTKISKC